MKSGRTGSLSTGEAARKLSVTPDTVLKWIKLGRLPAIRTAGGHHRIEVGVIERLLHAVCRAKESADPAVRRLRCWEYFTEEGKVREECAECAAYQVRAAFCFELMRRDQATSGQRLFCTSSCEDCPYYRQVHGLPVRVLLITADAALKEMAESSKGDDLLIRVVNSIYTASAEVGDFRPYLVVLDAALQEVVLGTLIQALSVDERIPWVRLSLIDSFPAKPLPSVEGTPATILSRSGFLDELRSMIRGKPVEQALIETVSQMRGSA